MTHVHLQGLATTWRLALLRKCGSTTYSSRCKGQTLRAEGLLLLERVVVGMAVVAAAVVAAAAAVVGNSDEW